MKANTVVPTVPRHAMIPVAAEPDETPHEAKEDALIRKASGSSGISQVKNNDDEMDDLDEMIFGKKTDGTSETGHATKKESTKDDLINF